MRRALLMVAAVSAAAFLYGCGGGGGGGGSSADTDTGSTAGSAAIGAQKPINTSADAARAADASVAIASKVANSNVNSLTSTVAKAANGGASSGRHVMDIILAARANISEMKAEKKRVVGKTVAAIGSDFYPYTEFCADGGSTTFDLLDSAGAMSIAYDDCMEEGVLKNGIFSMSGDVFIFGSSPDSPYEETYYSAGYTSVTGRQRMYMEMAVYSSDASDASGILLVNGYEEYYYYGSYNSSEKTEFTDFLTDYSYTEFVTGGSSTDMTMSGSFKYSLYDSVTMSPATLYAFEDSTFQDFRLKSDIDAGGWEELSIDGTMAYVSHPECMNGTYVVTTQFPITFNPDGYVTSGRITVNGVVIVYNADGSITATLNGMPVNVSGFADYCAMSF